MWPGQLLGKTLQFLCLPGVAPTCCRSFCAFCSAASASAAKALASADSLAAPLKSYRQDRISREMLTGLLHKPKTDALSPSCPDHIGLCAERLILNAQAACKVPARLSLAAAAAYDCALRSMHMVPMQ